MVRNALLVLSAIMSFSAPVLAATTAKEPAEKPDKSAQAAEEREAVHPLKDESQRTSQSITVGGRTLLYQTEAGVVLVHVKDPLDEEPAAPSAEHSAAPQPRSPEATLSYVAYFLGKQPDPRRPITFLFNGGPGSSTVWLHMGSFGPKRVLATDGTHSPAAPYRIVDNTYTLLPDSDLVFVDAPGTGFSHLRGADKEKAFYGVDQDAHAFATFITEFLTRHGRWNSPKYVFGESYGTMRAAALALVLQGEKGVDLNGVILLSQWLCADDNSDTPQYNPGVDQPYSDPGAVSGRGRAVRARRVPHRTRGGRPARARAPRRGHRQAARLHGTPGGLPRARGPADQRRRLQPTRARRQLHLGPPRHALHRTHD